MNTRNLVLGAVVVLCLGGALLMFARGSSTGAPPTGDEFTCIGVCMACEFDGECTYARGEPAPHKCSKCGELAVYPWFYCSECRARFVPRLGRGDTSEPPRLPEVIRCPNCGHSGVMPYTPALHDAEGFTDLPLPEWP